MPLSVLSYSNIYLQLTEMLKSNEPYVLTTITATYGSSPQKPGSSAIWNEKGLISGTIGGGSVENAVSKRIPEAINNKQSGYYNFSLNHEINDPSGSICGGGMKILLDSSPENSMDVFKEIEVSLRKYESGVLVTEWKSNSQIQFISITRSWYTSRNLPFQPDFPSEVSVNLTDMILKDASPECKEIAVQGFKGEDEVIYFLERIKPLPQLFIAGAGHVGKALSHLGILLDFEVIVWDDRPEYANPENLSDASVVLSCSLDELPDFFTPNEDSYIVIVTRGHRQDADVMRKFINCKVRYLGMMGSKRKILQIREKLLSEGWATEEQWNKVHTPIGIDIGSVTVQEIALSIAAELVKVRKRGNG